MPLHGQNSWRRENSETLVFPCWSGVNTALHCNLESADGLARNDREVDLMNILEINKDVV